MNSDDYIKAKLCDFAWREGSRHGGTNNMLACAFVIRNRVAAGWGDWLEVLANAPTHAATVYEAELFPPQPDIREPNFRRLLQLVEALWDGSMVDNITCNPKKEKALYYAELDKVNREWFMENICRKPDIHPRTSIVGPVTFFR